MKAWSRSSGSDYPVQRLIQPFQQFIHVDLDQVEQEILLGGDMVVERARLDADFGREPPQAHGLVGPWL